MLKKKIVNQFGKHYLLGRYKDGTFFYLQEPSWDRGRYWGFGYITIYTNNHAPEHSRDIQSHGHFEGLLGKQEVYDSEKGCRKLSSDYVHILKENPEVTEVVLSEKDQWTLSELITSGYALREAAELLGRGDSHYTDNPCSSIIKNEAEVKRINEVVLPAIFKEIEKLLTP